MQRKIISVLAILLLGSVFNSSVAYAESYLFRRHFYGGYIGIDLGPINQFEGSPLIGYRITTWLQTGIGAKYQYYYSKRLDDVFRAHIFGPLVFADVIPVQNLNDLLPFRFIEAGLYLHAEMNMLNLPTNHFDRNNTYPDQKRFFRSTWIAGAGLRRETVTGRYLHIMMIFDVSGHSNKLYSKPAVRFGFVF